MSTFSNSTDLAERALANVKVWELFHALVVTNAELIDAQKDEYDIIYSTYSQRICFELREGEFIKQLKAARLFMRKLYGTWKDEFESTWNPYGKTVIVSWRDKSNKTELWMKCTLDTFPESLYPSDRCSWTDDTTSKPTKALVCEV